MPSATPFFSIIIPTYNRAHLIGKTISSILNIDFHDFEILIIDDGSQDNTQQVVNGFTDERIHYFKKENGERGAARNYGAVRALGRYVNFFDSDDLMHRNHLDVAAHLITQKNEPEFFHLAYDYQLEDGTVTDKVNNFDTTLPNKILFNNRLSCNGVFLRRDIALQFPFEKNRILASSEDWELWIRLISRIPLHFSNEITSSVVNHDQRSLRTIAPHKVVARDLLFIDMLRKDEAVMKKYGRSFQLFVAERYTFFMLCFAETGHRSQVFKWGIRAFRAYPLILFSRRFLASVKNSFLS